ncbi:MAG TPA: vitamin B12 dependent-methionine synthase activation domain-containing protein [Verrucomicrobiae bacterium]|nr:vitamin B12 dependent-methionine synthase activation domain-containing protein [Verrucomicrobiae bacterium]
MKGRSQGPADASRRILDPLRITVSRPLVLLRLGYRTAAQVQEKTSRLLDEEIAACAPLVKARAVLAPFPIERAGPVLRLGERLQSAARTLRERLDGCDTAWLFAATIGDGVERRSATFSEKGELTRSLLVDAYGSAAAIALGLALEEAVMRECAPLGLVATRRTAPGYGDFDLEAQRPLVELLDTASIGITLTEDCLMLPAKSVSGVIGGRLPGAGREFHPAGRGPGAEDDPMGAAG